ncbi:MAG: hypothetical protein R3B81_05690 [bacterium]
MTTSTARCALCFGRLDEGSVDVAGETLCRTCAHLAVPSSATHHPPPAQGYAPAARDRQVREVPPHLDQDVDSVAERVCREAGVPLTADPEFVDEASRPLFSGEGTFGERLLRDIREWCAGRRWQVRVPVLLFFAWLWIRHSSDYEYQSVFKGLNLGIHELGHYVFAPGGDLLAALGGSLLQCLVPFIAMAMFVKQRDWFAVSFAWGWLATNYFELAPYVGDAVRMELPLVTPGGGHPIHDWNYILGDLGWLRYTENLAAAHTFAAHASMIVCLASMTWILVEMFRAKAPSR